MRSNAVTGEPELERELLRKTLHRGSGRHRCSDCRRTPLTGERVYSYAGGRVACELCRARRREDPVASQPVLGTEHGQSVRLTIRAAAA